MARNTIPLDAQSDKLLKQANQLLADLLAATSGTTLSVVHPRLRATIDELAKHRYAQVGVIEPMPTKK